jgi:hypothetical protein
MKLSTHNFENDLTNSSLCCPYCAGTPHLTWVGLDPVLYGFRCRDCGASIPPRHPNIKEATCAWNRRSGLAALGGKATRGIRSRRKVAAAKRNLRKAREVHQLNRMRQEVEAAFAAIKPYRQQETARIEAAVAKSRAELAILEPRIRQYPDLSEMLDDLKLLQAESDGGDRHHEDSPQPEPENSVLLEEHNEHDQS